MDIESAESGRDTPTIISDTDQDGDDGNESQREGDESGLPPGALPLPIEDGSYVAVEVPLAVRPGPAGVAACLRLLGGAQELARVTRSKGGEDEGEGAELLKLRYRPDDEMCHPIVSHRDASRGNLYVMEIRRRRRKLPVSNGSGATAATASPPHPEPFRVVSARILGAVDTSFVFRGLSDMQFLCNPKATATNAAAAAAAVAAAAPRSRHGKGATSGVAARDSNAAGQRPLLELLPPEFLPAPSHRSQYRFDARIQRNLAGVGLDELRAVVVGFGEAAPSAPATSRQFLATMAAEGAATNPLMSERFKIVQGLQEAFERCPLLTKIEAEKQFGEEASASSRNRIKDLIVVVAYYIRNGPWRRHWARYGYDPSRIPQARFLQKIEWRIGVAHLKQLSDQFGVAPPQQWAEKRKKDEVARRETAEKERAAADAGGGSDSGSESDAGGGEDEERGRFRGGGGASAAEQEREEVLGEGVVRRGDRVVVFGQDFIGQMRFPIRRVALRAVQERALKEARLERPSKITGWFRPPFVDEARRLIADHVQQAARACERRRKAAADASKRAEAEALAEGATAAEAETAAATAYAAAVAYVPPPAAVDSAKSAPLTEEEFMRRAEQEGPSSEVIPAASAEAKAAAKAKAARASDSRGGRGRGSRGGGRGSRGGRGGGGRGGGGGGSTRQEGASSSASGGPPAVPQPRPRSASASDYVIEPMDAGGAVAAAVMATLEDPALIAGVGFDNYAGRDDWREEGDEGWDGGDGEEGWDGGGAREGYGDDMDVDDDSDGDMGPPPPQGPPGTVAV